MGSIFFLEKKEDEETTFMCICGPLGDKASICYILVNSDSKRSSVSLFRDWE